MYEAVFAEMKELSEIERYCLDYFKKYGKYMEEPSSEEIIYFMGLSGMLDHIPDDLGFDEMLGRSDREEMTLLMTPESICFTRGKNIYMNISNRFFTAFEHSHDYIELECVLDGSAIHNPGTDNLELLEGAVVIVPPHIRHALQPIDRSVVVNIGIRFSTFDKAFRDILYDDTAVSGYFRNILYGKGTCEAIVLLGGLDHFTKHITAMLHQEQKANGILSDKINTHLVESMLYHLAESSRGSNVFDISEYRDDEINQVRLHILNHAGEVTLSSLSERFHRSEASMSRFIKRGLGMSFSDFLRNARMEYAKQLLDSTSLSIAEIAYRTGYENESYFIRVYREYHKITPYQYRKSRQSAIGE